MGITDDIADELAIEALKLEKATGDEKIVNKVSEILGASSQTTQEAYLTSVRVRRAEERARTFLADTAAALKSGETPD
ncbi:hypothetical protein [uncultured Litoreibacter sp.]|uniref:hypothetical protein n=1 Tax=uncultured Litoreibacter sp. TaxID=1392394 RepID=UPI00262A899D|nr:hypothetical protein [uncultured Litoreibacter sp.]